MCSTNSQLRAHRHITSNLMESNTPETSVCQENKTFISGKHVQPSTFFKYARTPSSSTLFFSCSRQRGEHFFVLNSLQCKESSREWKSKSQISPPPSQTDFQDRCDHVNGRQQAPSGFSSSGITSMATTTFVLRTSEKKSFFLFLFAGTPSSPCRAAVPIVTCENRESAANAPHCADSFVIY